MRQQARVTVGLVLGMVIVMGGMPSVGEGQTTTRVSVATGGGQADGWSYEFGLSEHGRFVAFNSESTNLVLGDTNNRGDVFVHDRQTGTTTRISIATGGGQGNADSAEAALSADGRFVGFGSLATNLVPGDTNGVADIFVHDRQTGTTTRVSVATGGSQANGGVMGVMGLSSARTAGSWRLSLMPGTWCSAILTEKLISSSMTGRQASPRG